MTAPTVVRAFPSALLSASLEDRLLYFKETAVVEHPNLTSDVDRLLVLTAYPTSRNLVLVIGPTGAGKSTLLKLLNSKINSGLNEVARAAGQVGSMYLELASPIKGAYDFQVMHRSALIAMNVPLVDRTRPIVFREVDGIRIPTLLVERDVAALRGGALEDRFYREIYSRKLRSLILDEARAIFKIGRPKNDDDRLERLKTQADLVKDIANAAKSTVILGGAYDFFDLSISSGQNARRSTILHVKPYDDSQTGVEGFATAITNLLCHLPIEHSIDPIAAATELFLQGLACVGTSAGILSEALREAIVTGHRLDMNLVRKYYYPAAALNTMRAEMDKGAERVEALMSLEELLPTKTDNAPTPSAGPDPESKGTASRGSPRGLKPGDSKPSHMAAKKGAW